MEAISADLQNTDSELKALQEHLQTLFTSPNLSKALQYFLCTKAYACKEDTLDNTEFSTLNQFLNSNWTDCFPLLLEKDTRDQLLDDLYCLSAFYQEKTRTLNEQTIILGCSDVIASSI